jgi:hypothetical protein
MKTNVTLPNVGEMIRSDVPPLPGASEHVVYQWQNGQPAPTTRPRWRQTYPVSVFVISLLVLIWGVSQILIAV